MCRHITLGVKIGQKLKIFPQVQTFLEKNLRFAHHLVPIPTDILPRGTDISFTKLVQTYSDKIQNVQTYSRGTVIFSGKDGTLVHEYYDHDRT